MVVFLLATSDLLQPIMSLGAQHTIIKFYSSFKNKFEKDEFLSSIATFFLYYSVSFVIQFHDIISEFLSVENPQFDLMFG